MSKEIINKPLKIMVNVIEKTSNNRSEVVVKDIMEFNNVKIIHIHEGKIGSRVYFIASNFAIEGIKKAFNYKVVWKGYNKYYIDYNI